jgi:hypothetical protein
VSACLPSENPLQQNQSKGRWSSQERQTTVCILAPIHQCHWRYVYSSAIYLTTIGGKNQLLWRFVGDKKTLSDLDDLH